MGRGLWRTVLIVVDSSAIVAIILEEPTADALLARLALETRRLMSVASYVETGTVLAGRSPHDPAAALEDLDAVLDATGVTLAPMDREQAELALQARLRYGRGMGHGGRLNFGDTFAYALARLHGAPLLFTGRDFDATDLEAALPPSQR